MSANSSSNGNAPSETKDSENQVVDRKPVPPNKSISDPATFVAPEDTSSGGGVNDGRGGGGGGGEGGGGEGGGKRGGSMVVLGATMQEDFDEPDLDDLPSLPKSKPHSSPETRRPSASSEPPLPLDPTAIRLRVREQRRQHRESLNHQAKELPSEPEQVKESETLIEPELKSKDEDAHDNMKQLHGSEPVQTTEGESSTQSKKNVREEDAPNVPKPVVRFEVEEQENPSDVAGHPPYTSQQEILQDAELDYFDFFKRQTILLRIWIREVFFTRPRYIQAFSLVAILSLSFRFLEPLPTIIDEPKALVHKHVLGEDVYDSLNTTFDEFNANPVGRRFILQRRFRQAQTLAVDTLYRAAEVSDYCLALKHAPSIFEPHIIAQPKPGPKFQYLPRWMWPKEVPRPHDLAPLADGLRKLESLLNPRTEGPDRDSKARKPQKSSSSSSSRSRSRSMPLAFAAVDKFGSTLHSLATEHASAIRRLNMEIDAANRGVSSARALLTNPFTNVARRRQAASARKALALAAFYRDTSRAVLERAGGLNAVRARVKAAIGVNSAFVRGAAFKAAVRRFGRQTPVPRVVRSVVDVFFLGASPFPSSSSSSGGGGKHRGRDARTGDFSSLAPSTYSQLREIVAVTRDVGRCGAALDDLEQTLSVLGAITGRVAEMIELAGGGGEGGQGLDQAGGDGGTPGGDGAFSEGLGSLVGLEQLASDGWSWALADVPLLFPLLVVEPHVSYRQAEMAKWRYHDAEGSLPY